jgi:E3 ubiquitin-protein ligase NEDD4
MSMHHIQEWYLQRPEEGLGSPGTGDVEDCEPPCGCWDLNSGPSEDQSVLLTAEPSLQPSLIFFFFETGS